MIILSTHKLIVNLTMSNFKATLLGGKVTD